jgi:adenosylcobinamide-GDP ribazoletransferase
VLALRALPYVGHLEASRWKPAPANPSWGETTAALILSAWPFLFLTPDVAAMGLALGGALALAATLTVRRRLGGYTGDVLGAVEQAFEVGFFIGVAALADG